MIFADFLRKHHFPKLLNSASLTIGFVHNERVEMAARFKQKENDIRILQLSWNSIKKYFKSKK